MPTLCVLRATAALIFSVRVEAQCAVSCGWYSFCCHRCMSSFSPGAGKTQEQSEWEQPFECNLTPISSLIYIYPQLHVPAMSPLISKYHRVADTILAPVSKEIFTPPRRGRAKAQIQFTLLRFSQHALLSLPARVVCLSVTAESSHWKTAPATASVKSWRAHLVCPWACNSVESGSVFLDSSSLWPSLYFPVREVTGIHFMKSASALTRGPRVSPP